MRRMIWINALGLVLGIMSAAEIGYSSADTTSNIDAIQPAESGVDGSAPISAEGRDSGPIADTAPGTLPIDPPVPDDCITDVSAGDHSFNCDGMNYRVMVDEKCTKYSCGLIFDVHGASMNGEDMRTNTELHLIAPPRGYLTVHPTSPTGSWAWATDPPKLVNFMDRMVKVFHVDNKRIHMTGFSMGSAMTFWFLCNHNEALASVAPVTGMSADQVTVVGTGKNCIQSIDANWQPQVPILFMSGTRDNALTTEKAQARVDGIVTRLGLTGGDVIDSGNGYTRRRWQGKNGMVFDFLQHDYSAAERLAGHCIPGGSKSSSFACTIGNPAFHYGEVTLKWFIEHPKK